MKMRFPLFAQIGIVFGFNILLLLAVYLFVFSEQYGCGWEAILYSPIGERIQSVAFVIRKQVRSIPQTEWNRVLAEFGEFYGVKFYLCDVKGQEIAGEKIDLPPQVAQKLMESSAHQRHHMGLDRPGHPDAALKNDANGVATNGAATSGSATDQSMSDNGPDSNKNGQADSDSPSPGANLEHAGSEKLAALSPENTNSPPPAPFAPRPSGRFFVHTHNPEMTWIGAWLGGNRHNPNVLIAATPNLWQTKLIMDFGPVLLLGLAIFVISSLVWWPFIYGISSALNRLTSTAEKIAEGKFDTALRMHRSDEIGRLAQAISIMTGRLKNFVYGQKRFLGDIAHELCSPIARLQIAIALLEPSCTKEQASALDDIREEVDQMSCLINELLAFSKAGIRGQELQLVNINLEALLKKVSSSSAINIRPTVEMSAQIVCLGDELLLERAFGNILRNAERYAPGSGPVLIRAEQIDNDVVISFADNGPGVHPDSLALLGEPFFRPEASRNRSSGGVGLGLAIVKTCIEACQGTVTLRNRQPKGLEVEVKLLAAVS